MKIKTVLLFVLILTSVIIHAEIIESTPVGPGVMYYHDYLSAGPWHLYVLEVDLTNEWIAIETVKSGDVMSAYEKTSSMANRKDREEHRIVGAVNGDFYGTGGIPINAQVLQGELLRRPITREVFGMSDTKEPFAGIYSFSGTIWGKMDTSATIHGVNETRNTNYLVVYNRYMGPRSGTNEFGTEIIAEYISDPLVNDTVLLKITVKDSIMATGHGNNSIPANGLVISGHGTSGSFLNQNVYVGDTIKVMLKLRPETRRIQELIGGGPAMISNSVVVVPGGSFSTDRHPRTAVGFSQDSTKLYLFVVDGRQAGFSVGMSLYELADYMKEWGVYHGINLDGGGSSTMLVRSQIRNRPSDSGVERSVANALMVVSKTPTSDFARLRISPREVFLLSETGKQFQVKGYDQYYNQVSFQSELLGWECGASLGSISTSGLFTAGTDTMSGYVYAMIDTVRDSVSVHVTNINSIELEPQPIILKIGEKQQVYPIAKDNYGNVIDLSTGEFNWSVTGNVGTVSTSGLFSAENIGEGEIIAEFRDVTGSTSVSVGVAASVVIDNFDNVDNWSLSGVIVDLNNSQLVSAYDIYQSFPSSGRLDYALTTGGTTNLNMNCSIPISGTPNAVGIWVYGDGKQHWLRGEFIDRDNEKFLVNFTEVSPGIDWSGEWRYLEVFMENAIVSWANPSAVLNYPITWKRIYLAETDDSKKDQSTIFFDDFTIQFIESSGIEETKKQVADHFRLEKQYPNPFNNTSNFQIQLIDSGDITFTFYNVNGKEVDKMMLLNKGPGQYTVPWIPRYLPSGIYFYNIQMESQKTQGKCLLIK